MRIFGRSARRAAGVLACLLLAASSAVAQQKKKGTPPPVVGPPVTMMTEPCGPTTFPCEPHISIANNTFASVTRPPESGPYSYTFTVVNNGEATGTFSVDCLVVVQVSCVPNPEAFSLAEDASRVVTVTYSTMGLGRFSHRLWITANGEEGLADQDTLTHNYITVSGVPMATHFQPLNGGVFGSADTLEARLSHPSGINTASFKLLIDGTLKTSTVTSTKLTATAAALNLTAGTHTWTTYGCAVNGRCDTVKTTFTAIPPPTAWSLDDSLPPPQGHGIEGLLGGLSLPLDTLRGCPVDVDDPEIRLTSPTSFLSQPGSGSAPGGLVFAASVGMNDTLRIATATVDFKAVDNKTCAQYGYLERSNFDWDWWTGSDAQDTLWTGYPYGDLFALEIPEADDQPDILKYGYQVASLGRVFGPSALAALPASRPWSGSRRAAIGPVASLVGTRRGGAAARAMLPSPGAIKPSTFRLTLNGTLIVAGSTPQVDSVNVVQVLLTGASVRVPANHALLRKFNPASPLSNSGGWNELIATISDSTGHTSSVRARFVQMDPGLVAPLPLVALRDFSHLDQGECAAVGVFQCGGVMLSYGIPTYVSRDRDRSLHLVYRSASQRAPTILPVQLSVPREQKAPDSVHVLTLEGGALRDSLRYAGTKGTVTGIGSSNLWEHADEARIVGAVLPAAPSGNFTIRSAKALVRQYYPGTSRVDTVGQEVVQLHLSDSSATRWGQGWQLAELNRLIFGQTSQGLPAAIWLSGDGSYTIFREVSTNVWAAAPGETARMVRLGTVTNNARYVIYLENGSRIGFASSEWQVYTADLLGNLTTYQITSAGRLNSITDPTGNKIVFNHGSSGIGANQVASIDVQHSGSANVRVADFAYDTVNGGVTLKKIKIFHTPEPSDSTIFKYKRGGAPGAFVDSIIDPRSTTALPVVSTFAYDTITWTPEFVRRPADRFGVAQMAIRDQWRRAIPRAGYGRFTGSALERMVHPNQLRGTVINYANNPTDFRVDRFGSPTFVSVISQGTVGGGFLVPSSAADDVRDIERDTLGRVVKIVHGRNVHQTADSVMYQYDALSRVQRMIRSTAAFPVVHPLDTVTFTYDSITLATNAAWCSRLLTSTDPMGGVTSVGYGATGVARCLPTRMVGLAADTTLFTYGPLVAGDPAGVRPVKTRDPVGLADSVSYESMTWNTAAHVRLGDMATSRAYYNVRGHPDSMIDAEGMVTRLEKNRSMRVIYQRTGSDSTSPTVRTVYGNGGLVLRTDVHRSLATDMMTAVDTIQSTRNYFDRLGQLDSTIVPGVRTSGNKTARIQVFQRDRSGVPTYEYPGNGTYIARLTDWRGRIILADYGTVDYTRSIDGERFADPATDSLYRSLNLSMGAHLSAGQVYAYYYDNKGRPIATMGRDLYLGGEYLTQRSRGYSRTGALVGDTLVVSEGATLFRRYEYNRRGQRTVAADTILVTAGSLGSEGNGRITYHYNSLTARLDSMVGVSGGGAVGRVRWLYDRAGRDTLQGVVVGSAGSTGEIVTLRRYDVTGQSSYTQTKNSAAGFSGTGANSKEWFRFELPTYDKLGNLKTASGLEPDHGARTYEYAFTTDGGYRLNHSRTIATNTIVYNWVYDVFGNKRTEQYSNTGATNCVGTAPMDYGADNRLLLKHTYPGCTSMSRYWTDQTGNRLVETDSLTGVLDTRSVLSYTAANQLYYSVTPTASAGSYDLNWNWYDGDGRRVITHVDLGTSLLGKRPETAAGSRLFYLYDGDDVALVLAKMGSTWSVRQRVMSGGLDRPLVTRISPSGGAPQNLAFIVDRQGTTLAAVKPDGLRDGTVAYFGRNAFGRIEGGAAGSTNTETGFTGASTPNQAGGFTYLRNRWYDPQSGRFLTQDPIGLAGGVNLYAYAGNNPVSFSDPYGLCAPFCTALIGAAIGGGAAFLGTIGYNAFHDQPLTTNLARNTLIGGAAGGAIGLGVGFFSSGTAAGSIAAAGTAASKVPFDGFQKWGREAVGWGQNAAGAVRAAGEMTAEKAASLDPAKIQAAKQFYENAVANGKGGAAAQARVELMKKIIELQE